MAATAPFRWRRRRVSGGAVRAACTAGPLVLGVAISVVVVRTLPDATTWWARLGAVVLASAAGMVAVFLADRAWRRMLPLAALLEMSLGFPDHAPSRLRAALRAGSPKRLLAETDEAHRDRTAHAATVLALAAGLTVHDRATRGHSERVRAYAELIADELGLDEGDHDRLRWAALLHDIGKVTVPTATLNADHRLSDEEWELLKHHPEEGARLTEPLAPWLGAWALAVAEHHERYDGDGYPRGLAGEELSLAGRIVCVADSYDAMTTDRSYSKAMLPGAARQQLVDQAGRQFDPKVVRAFLEVGLGRIRRIIGPVGLIAAAPILNELPSFTRHARRAVSLTAMAVVSVTAIPTTATTIGADAVTPHHKAPSVEATPPNSSEAPAAPPSTVVLTVATGAPHAAPSSVGESAHGTTPSPTTAELPCQVHVGALACVGAEATDDPSVTAHAEAAGQSYTATVAP